MPYSIITSDNFTRSNTSVGSGANSTNVTGPGTFNSPGTGANYVDTIGSAYYIGGNQLLNTGLNSGSFSDSFLLRPTPENTLNGQVAVTGVVGSGGSALQAVARYASGKAYCASFYINPGTSTGSLSIDTIGPGNNSLSQIAAASPTGLSSGTSYVVTLQFSGTSPTALTATLATAAAPGTVIQTVSGSSSAAGLQAAGQMGISANQTGQAVVVTGLTTYALTVAGPAANVTISPTSAALTPNGTQTFAVGLDGTLANGTNVTVNLSTTIGTLGTNAVTFSGTGVQPATQNVTLTAPSSGGTGTLSGTNTGSLGNFAGVPITVAAPALTVGALTLTETDAGGISVGVSSGLSGGTGTGYSYSIYRGTDPNFTAGPGSLLATASGLPYLDTTAQAGVQYFYGVTGKDSASSAVFAVPAGITGAASGTQLFAAAVPNTAGLNVVFVGDSITYSAGVSNAGTMLSPTAPFFCVNKLKRLLGTRNVYAANKGVSGYTATDWAPGGSTYNGALQASNASSAASLLNAANPAAQMVVSVMLGGNDSASSGTNNGGISGGLTPAQFATKLKAIVDQVLTVDWPAAKVFLHAASWYSPNFRNSSTYLQDGLSRLFGYRQAITGLVSAYAASNPNQVFLGDTYSFDYFAKNYAAEQQAESGANGTFYVHPSGSIGTNGNVGTQSLGEMWAAAMANALYAGFPRSPSVIFY